MSRQPPRGRRIRNTPASTCPSRRWPCSPQLKWLATRPRSITRRGVRHGNHLEVSIDKFAAGALQNLQKETEDKIGQSVAAGDPKTPAANPLRPRALQSGDARAPPPSATSHKFVGTKSSSSSSSPSEEHSGLTWQTVPIVEAVILPLGRQLHMTVAPQIVKQETLDSESHFPTPKRNKTSTRSHTWTIKQEVQSGIQSGIQSWQSASPSSFKHTRSIMSPPGTARGGARRGGGRGRGFQRRPSSPESTVTATGSTSSYTPPPHPYSTGKVSKVNICPICEKYTVTELDRPADSDPSDESLRTRFKCELCSHIFDLGIPLFDPRGSPGVTLYEGEDRFVPPVPPRATYPCPKCWRSSDSSFQCITVYLKEESRVPCEPACRAGRTRGADKEKGVKTTEKRTTRQSTKWCDGMA